MISLEIIYKYEESNIPISKKLHKGYNKGLINPTASIQSIHVPLQTDTEHIQTWSVIYPSC